MFWTLLMIQVIAVLLVDVTGVVEDMLNPIVRWLTGSKIGQIGKPFNCSTCVTFWVSICYILITHQFGFLSLMLTLILACSTDLTLAIFHFCKDVVSWVFDGISRLLNL